MTQFSKDNSTENFGPRAPINVVLYARVSTSRQLKNDISIPDQIKQLNEYCASQGWHPAEVYVDDRSGTSDNRPEFQEMVDLLTNNNQHSIRHVVVHFLSRIFRNSHDAEIYTKLLKSNKVTIISITQQVGDGPLGNMFRRMISNYDEYFSEENSKHVLRSRLENARQGFFNGGRPPFGYYSIEAERRGDKIKKRLDIKPEEAKKVRQIYSLFLMGNGSSGSLGVKAITSFLNEHGITYRNGGKWGVGDVYRVLNDTVYIGKYQFNRSVESDEKFYVPVPGIIGEVEFSEVQLTLRSRNPRITAPRTITSPILLGGIAKCSFCGGGMTLRTAKSGKYRYYTCGTSARKGKTACQGLSIPMALVVSVIKDTVSKACFGFARTLELMEMLVAKCRQRDDSLGDQVQLCREKLKEIESRLGRLWDAVENGGADIKDPVFKNRLHAASAERETASNALDRALANITPKKAPSNQSIMLFLNAVNTAFNEPGSIFAREYVRAIFEKIVISPDTLRIVKRLPEDQRHGFRVRNGTAKSNNHEIVIKIKRDSKANKVSRPRPI